MTSEGRVYRVVVFLVATLLMGVAIFAWIPVALANKKDFRGESGASGPTVGGTETSEVTVDPDDSSLGDSERSVQEQDDVYIVHRVVENRTYSEDAGSLIACLGAPPDENGVWGSVERVPLETVRIDTINGTEEHLGFECVLPSEAESVTGEDPVVIVVTLEEFESLSVNPLVANAGPITDWLPVGMANVLYVEPETQTLETVLLGTPVSVRAIPVSYHWDLGDGNTITTEKPGEPYPSEQVSSTYSSEGWYDITLTTTFRGEFSVDGGPWQEIDGTIEVASEPRELFSKSLESRLVNPDVPVDEDEDPWIPPRTEETEGPRDPDAQHRTI